MQATRRSSWYLVGSRWSQIRTNTHQVKVKPYSKVPGPKPIPLLGNAWRFLPVVGTFETNNLMKWANDLHKEYGDVVKISNIPGRNDMLLVFDPDCIETVFRNEGQWPLRFPLESVRYFRSKVRPDFFEGFEGLVNENGESWQKARTAVNQPMMQPRVAKQYAGKIDQVAQDFVKRIPALRDEKQEMPSNFNNELHKWALESIALVALDTRLGCLEPSLRHDSDPLKMIEAVDTLFDASFHLDLKMPIWKIINTPTLKKFVKHANIFLNISHKYVKLAIEKMSDSTPEEEQSVLQRILKRDPSTKRAVIMAMDMMTAGIDTTSSSSAIVLYHLARNPECQERLFAEVSKVMPAGPSEPLTAENLDSMKYLKACIKESMRISPVTTGNFRTIPKEIQIKDYQIPGNVDIMMLHSIISNKDKHFPDANKFIPERWLRDEEKCPHSQHRTHPFVFLPFGHGPRQCVGFRFANMEMETLVARMVRNYRLEWHHSEMTFASKLLHLPNDPLKFKIIDRPR